MKAYIKYTFLLFFGTSFFCISQNNYRYCSLVNNLKFVLEKQDTLRQNSDSYSFGNSTIYEYNGNRYNFKSSLHQIHQNNGSQINVLYDDYGNILSKEIFDKNSLLVSQEYTNELGSSYSSTNDFLVNLNRINYYRTKLRYKYNRKKTKQYVVQKRETRLNSNLLQEEIVYYNKKGEEKRRKYHVKLHESDTNYSYTYNTYKWSINPDPGAFKLNLTIYKKDSTTFKKRVFFSSNRPVIRERFEGGWRNSEVIYSFAGITPSAPLGDDGNIVFDYITTTDINLRVWDLGLNLPTIKPQLGKKLEIILYVDIKE